MVEYDMKKVGVLVLAITLVISISLYLFLTPPPVDTGTNYPYNPQFSEYYSGELMEDSSCFPANYLMPNPEFFIKEYIYVLLDVEVTLTEDGLRFDQTEIRSPQGLLVEKYFICDKFGDNATSSEIDDGRDQVIFPNVTNPAYYQLQFGELDGTYADTLEPIDNSVTPSLSEIYSMSLSAMDALSWGDISIEKSFDLEFLDWTASCPCKFRLWINDVANSTYNINFGSHSIINATFGSELTPIGNTLTVQSNDNYNILEAWFT